MESGASYSICSNFSHHTRLCHLLTLEVIRIHLDLFLIGLQVHRLTCYKKGEVAKFNIKSDISA